MKFILRVFLFVGTIAGISLLESSMAHTQQRMPSAADKLEAVRARKEALYSAIASMNKNKTCDGDGQCELITGKRFLSHPHNEPGVHDAFGWYIFKWTGECFAKQVIDFGPFGVGHGLGISFAVADLNGDGRLDVVAPGKEGLAVYFNEGDGELTEMPVVK